MRRSIKVQLTNLENLSTVQVENQVSKLIELQKSIKVLEREAEFLKNSIKDYMGVEDELFSRQGVLLATWKPSSESIKVDEKVLKAEFPDIFELCSKIVPGVRRFLIK